MSSKRSRLGRYAIYIFAAIFLVSFTGCGSANSKVMSSMPKKNFSDVNQYKVAIAEKTTIDKILTATGTTRYKNFKVLSFKNNGGHLKAVYVKLGDNVSEGDLLAELDTADLGNELSRKQIELERTRLRHDKMLMDEDLNGGGNKTEIKNLEYDMEAINLEIGRISREISDAKLTAPFAGIVSTLSAYNIGSEVDTYVPFVTVSKPNELEITSYEINPPPDDFALSEIDPSGVVTGMKAIVQYHYKNEKYDTPATITRIINTEPGIRINGVSNITNAPQVFQVWLDLTGPTPTGMLVNQSITIKINTGKLENVIIVPGDAVSGFGEDTIVKVIKNGRVTKRSVTAGYQDKTAKIVVITSGLKAGESVIIDR